MRKSLEIRSAVKDKRPLRELTETDAAMLTEYLEGTPAERPDLMPADFEHIKTEIRQKYKVRINPQNRRHVEFFNFESRE